MTTRKKAGGPDRRAVSPRGWARPPGLAFLGLALVGLAQIGCQSDGCKSCGGFGSKLTNGVQALGAKVFHHKSGCGESAGCGCGEEGTSFDSGIPVVPGGMVVPAPGTIVPAPAIESTPPQLEAIPSNKSTTGNGGPTSTRSVPGSTNRSGYTTMLPKSGIARRRGADVAQAVHSATGDPASSADLLDNIPPVDLPSDVTRKAANAGSGPTPVPDASRAPSVVPVTNAVSPTPAEKVSAAEGGTLSLPPIDAIAAHRAPGIRRFGSVAPSVGGGSAPSIEGLDWLKEKGYRTFVDLRRGKEIEPNFADSVNDRGMVYISLPIVANLLDASRLARFDDLIATSDNRPLYFCDTDGTRAGLAWYIHLRSVDQEDPLVASSKAEEIGLTDAEVKLAEDYLANHKPRARAAMARAGSPMTPEPKIGPKAISVPPTALPTSALIIAPADNSAVPPSPSDAPTPSMLPGEHRPQAASNPVEQLYRDPALWRPVAALVLTGIGVPLAYWSRSAFGGSRTGRFRASLPASSTRSFETRAASDA